MKTKRVLSMLLVLAMVIGCLAGCGSKETSRESSETVKSSAESSKEAAKDTAKDAADGPITTDPITISILLLPPYNSFDQVNGDELWFFKYLEWWMNDQGYNITLEVTNATEVEQQLSLMLASDNLPDLIWGPELSTENAVLYGAGEGMILDWSPYLNEETMPNVMALAADNPDAIAASTCPDGGVYSLPGFANRGWGQQAGNQPHEPTLFVNSKWLEASGIEELPTTYDGFIDMLRAFKANVTLEDGLEVVPFIATDCYMAEHLWGSLGYYGWTKASNNGTEFAIKDGEVCLPAATEDYRTYIEYMKLMYDEGLISRDFLTQEGETALGMASAGQCGVMGVSSLIVPAPETWADWVGLPTMTAGDNDTVIANVNTAYYAGKLWASASTEYPEVLAYMLDYVYSPEGSVYYYYGPMKGTDPLGLLDGWYYDEEGNVTCEEVENENFDSFEFYFMKYVCPDLYMCNYIDYIYLSKEMAGLDANKKTVEWPDAIRGNTYEVVWKIDYTDDNADGHMRYERVNNWKDHVTTVKLPPVYMSSDDVAEVAEMKLILDDYINVESAKFITGVRPLEEIDDYFEELKGLGVDQYIEIYREAYSTYIDSVFK